MGKNKILKMLAVNAIVLASLLFTQNCGNVNLGAPILVERPSLAISVSSTLLQKVSLNTPVSFAIPTEDGSAKINSVSLESSSLRLSGRTQLQGVIIIDSTTWEIFYSPAPGVIGNDSVTLYVIGEDNKEVIVDVTFVIRDPEFAKPPFANLLAYSDNTEGSAFERRVIKGESYEQPSMGTIFSSWSRFAGVYFYQNQNQIDEILNIPSNENLKLAVAKEIGRRASSECKVDLAGIAGIAFTDPATNAKVTYSCLNTSGSTTNSTQCSNIANSLCAASSWHLLEGVEQIVCPVNSAAYTGFISSAAYDRYTHEAVLTSDNADDDFIFLVIAAYRGSDNQLYTLSLDRNMNKNSVWALRAYRGNSTTLWSAPNTAGGGRPRTNGGTKVVDVNDGWSGLRTKVRVVRAGNVITAETTDWYRSMQEAYFPESIFVLNLDNHTLQIGNSTPVQLTAAQQNILDGFKGPQLYGYGSRSQANTTFLEVSFKADSTEDRYAYDLVTNSFYEKGSDGKFFSRTDMDAYDHIGAPRLIGNPETNICYCVHRNKTFSVVNCSDAVNPNAICE